MSSVLVAVVGNGRFAVTGDLAPPVDPAAPQRPSGSNPGNLTVIDTGTFKPIAHFVPGAPPEQLLPLRPPPVAVTPVRRPRLQLLRGAPDIVIQVTASDAPIDPQSAHAFFDERDLTPLVRLVDDRITLALGSCERYPGTNFVTVSVSDTATNTGKLLVQFVEPSEPKNGFLPGEVLVTFHDGHGPMDPTMRACARRLGAITMDGTPDGGIFDSLVVYRVPACLDVLKASKDLGSCPGVNSAAPDTVIGF